MPFTAYYLSPEGKLQRDLTEKEIKAAFESKQGLLWVEDNGRLLKRGVNFLAHALIDNILPTVDKMTELSEEIEEEVNSNA